MPISIYSTRAMAAAMRQDKPTGHFLLDTLFVKVDPVIAGTVDIDIIKGKRRIAPFQSPRVEGKLVEKLGFTTNSYKPAYVKPLEQLSAEEVVNNRIAGESIYSLKSPQERAQILLAQQLNNMEDMIARREEWMCAQQLVNGYVDVIGDGVNYRIDLLMDATHKTTLAGTDKWDNAASDPDSDITDAVRLISKDAGLSANIMIGNTATMGVYVKHAKVKDNLNTRRIDLGMIAPQDMGEGVSYYGYVNVDGKIIDLYGYDNWYVDDSDVEQPMIPNGQVIITTTKADFRRHYGAIVDLDAVDELGTSIVALPRFPKKWREKNPSADFLLVQSAPLPAAHQIDAIVSMKVF